MAQDITLMGANYEDVPAVTLPKTGGGTASFFDISDTTATASDVMAGAYFYTAAGVRTEGTSTGGGITITDTTDTHGGTIREITATVTRIESSKTVTPTTSQQTITPSTGYDAMAEVVVNAVPTGSASTPATSITANPTISVGSSGLITASVSTSQNVTPTVSAGYVSSGTAGTITVSGSNTSQMTTKAATTYHPSTSNQTISSGAYLTGTQTIAAVVLSNLLAENIKSGVTVKVGDSSDDDCVASVLGTYTGGGTGSGLVYESGTYTPTADDARPTISFANSHSTTPILVAMSDTSSSSGITSNSNTAFVYFDMYRLTGSGYPYSTSATRYSIAYYTYRSSSGSTVGGVQTQYNSDNTGSSSTSYSRYFATASAFYPYSNSSSRYWRRNRTYKWIAIWGPS